MSIKKLQAMKAKKGFTLVELIVVIAIIAVLAAILIPIMLGHITNSQISSANSDAKSIHNVTATFTADLDNRGLSLFALATAGGTLAAPANIPINGGVVTVTGLSTIVNGGTTITLENRMKADAPGLRGSGWIYVVEHKPVAVFYHTTSATTGDINTTGGSNGSFASGKWDTTLKKAARGNVYGTYPECNN